MTKSFVMGSALFFLTCCCGNFCSVCGDVQNSDDCEKAFVDTENTVVVKSLISGGDGSEENTVLVKDLSQDQLNMLLFYAVNSDKIYVVKLLIGQRVDVNIRDNDNKTPLTYALGIGNTEMIEYLQENGAVE